MIYLIRHGEAASSWGEHPDPGLSANGQAQAQAVAAILERHEIKQVITSPMARCQETASYFARQSGLNLTIEPNVTEIPTPNDIKDRVAWLRGLMSGNWSDAPALVEAWRTSLLNTLAVLPANTAVFTHFVAINAVVGHLEQTDTVTVFRPNYCSLTKIETLDGSLKLVARGDSLETKVL